MRPWWVARRSVRLVGGPARLAASPGDWLKSLRWVAIFGMLCTIVVAKLFVPGIRLLPLFGCLGGVALFNAVSIATGRPRSVLKALAFDVSALAVVLWFSGGVGNPFAVFLSFQVLVAALIASHAEAGRIAMLVVLAALLLLRAPPLPWETAGERAEEVRRVGQLAALVGVAVFMGVSSYAFGQRLEELRAESARAARFADLGRVAGGIAHEVNTPLATIVVASGELVSLVRGSSSDEVVVLGEVIAEQAKRASDVIALVRGQVRSGDLAELLDVGALASRFVPAELCALGYAGTYTVDVKEGVIAWGISTAIQQILSNLLKNAVEATREVEAARIEVAATTRPGAIVLGVRDNGCGIRPDELQRIGQPFHTTKASSAGAGLGLYVSGLLARQMEGQLEIDASGSGTLASLSLRRAPPARGVDG